MTISKNDVYYLTFLDINSRLDILMLEIRSVQQLIIYLLKEPSLYNVLLDEEKYIFDFVSIFENGMVNNLNPIKSASIFIKDSIKPYPPLSKPNNTSEPNGDELQKIVDNVLEQGLWNREQRRNYLALTALQTLKQKILYDKLTLYLKARKLNIFKSSGGNEDKSKAAFLVLRAALLKKTESYLANLNTHKQLLEKSLNFNTKEFPKPEISRRKEIGIFQDFLSTRIVDLKSEMVNLLDFLLGDDSSSKNKEIMTLHGWSRDNVMSSSYIKNVDEKCEHVIYIDTSFWLPDRPDLLPLVAKEIALSLNKIIFSNFSQSYIHKNSGKCNSLIDIYVQLSRVITNFCQQENNDVTQEIKKQTQDFLKIFMDDLLALSCKGVAYFYSLFLMIVCENSHKFLEIDGRLHLNVVDDLESGGGSIAGVKALKENFIWYFRIKLIHVILKEMHLQINTSDKCLLDTVSEVVDDFVNFIEADSSWNVKKISFDWQKLFGLLKNVIIEHDLIKKLKRWVENRTIQSDYHGSTAKLNSNLVSKLLEFYDGRILDKKGFVLEYLKDVPYQCLTMNSENFPMEGDYQYPKAVKFHHLNHDAFFLSLEFYLWQRECLKLKKTLVMCLNFIKECKSKSKNCESKKLNKWLTYSSIKNIRLDDSFVKSVLAKKQHVSAYDVMSIKYNSFNGNDRDRMEELFKFKIMSLMEVLGEFKDSEYCGLHINNLRSLLNVYMKSTPHNPKEENALFYNKLFGSFDFSQKGKGSVSKILVSRFDITTSYNGGGDGGAEGLCKENGVLPSPQVNRKSRNALSFHQAMTFIFDSDDFVPVLGEYEAVQLLPIKTYEYEYYKLPNFSNLKDEALKLFPSYFLRRETAIAFKVNIPAVDTIDSILREQFHFISVINLRHREVRLSFVYRMLEGENEEAFSEKLKSLFTHFKVLGLLTDGWGDLLLVFYPRNKKDCNLNFQVFKDFFELQKIFYRDLIVERTESIITPYVLDYVGFKEDIRRGVCKLIINARFIEGRELISESLDEMLKSLSEYFDIFLMPGKLDLQLIPRQTLLDEIYSRSSKSMYLYLELLKVMEDEHGLLEYIDRLETNIIIKNQVTGILYNSQYPSSK